MSPARPDATAGLRHELRTPLNHILGYTEMLLEDARAQGRTGAAQALERIHQAARELLPLINALDRARLGPLLERIGEETRALLKAASPQEAADLDKIRAAAAQLIRFAERGAAPAPPPPAGPQPAPAEPFAGATGHLLVVDDNPENRELLRRLLLRQGYSVSLAENGLQALEMLRAGGFDLVLLDIMMPELDGMQALAEIKADNALRGLPVIMISALDELASVVRSIEMGAEDYLAKPFDPVLLKARIGASLDKKRLRDQLLVQEKLASLGALTAGIAHEIRNPLNFVTNFAELAAELVAELREELGEEARAGVADLLADLEQNVSKIREHGGRADDIVRGMLMHSRGERGERRPADLNALVEENVSLAFHSMRAQNAAFNVLIEGDYDPAVGRLSVVPEDLGRVFLNIANNAFYAAHQKKLAASGAFTPTVWVRTRSLGAQVEVRIRDNGNGIPAALRERVFTPFFTTKPAGSGTGLGLSISYDIVVSEHHGELRVDSEEGRWAEFCVTLPKTADREDSK